MNSPAAAELKANLVKAATERPSPTELSPQDQLELHLVTECHAAIFHYLMAMRNPATRTVGNLHEYAMSLAKSLLEQSSSGLNNIKLAGERLAQEPLGS
jgi:hypothetical protein